MYSQSEVFKEFGKLPDTVCIQGMVANIIIYKNTYGYFTFLTNLADHKAQHHMTWRLILDQLKKNKIKQVNLLANARIIHSEASTLGL